LTLHPNLRQPATLQWFKTSGASIAWLTSALLQVGSYLAEGSP
jgi:hypothetical protein